jgi:serine O-acetyltransferase
MIKEFLRRLKWDFLTKLGFIQVLHNVPISTILPHPIGVVIAPSVKLGDSCVLYQGVTLGNKSRFNKVYPVIGNNVTVYSNAIVVGNVSVGDGAVVGAGCVVVKDVPVGGVVVGNPGRLLK